MKTKDHDAHGLKKNRFQSLLLRFEEDYSATYARLADQLKGRYPDIIRNGRRTARALRNIGFFVWCYARSDDKPLIPVLFNASVLLSAQDDFYDNPRIPNRQKEAFCSATNQNIRADFPQSITERTGKLSQALRTRQTQELLSFWSDVARSIRGAEPSAQSYWKEKACQLNDAMATESRAFRRADLSFDEYMHTAVHSVGMVFVWSTYLVHRGVSPSTARAIDPVLLLGAKIARLSNDIASYRLRKDKQNSIMLLGGGPMAERRVIQLIAQESRKFRGRVDELPVEPGVRRVMLRSTEFLAEFYQRSDFDKRPLR